MSTRIPALVLALFALLPATALAHIERPSYWPDPAADTTVSPAAGGAFPEIRTLASALDNKAVGDTRVVCRPDSLERATAAISAARTGGYDIRPQDHRALSGERAKELLQINRKLFDRCTYDEIQPAVTASRNNDRVVVMPGLYTEPTSRKARTHDPACDQYEIPTEFGDPGALSYAYQWHCPNDQNLIAVLGREPGPGADPSPPPEDRHGIPNLGPCVRCNLQIEGSGVSADDVVVDAGRVESGNGPPSNPVKDVGIRADRADGFVLRNMTFRHAREDGIYVIETDGYMLDRFKVFYNGSYGTLTFVSDHGVHQDCQGKGHSDSAIYPGAAPETGEQRAAGTEQRYNQVIRRCSMHHNLAGYSGTNGNGIHMYDNDIYDNALGIQTDVVTSAGHPGFPGDSSLFEKNRIFDNNFNPYLPGSDVGANFPFPVGTGMWIAGGNNHTVSENHIYDNWRRGTMLYAVPDALVCGPATDNEQAGCDEKSFSTSHNNTYTGNIMGASPAGDVLPNGTDFWWDSFPGSRGNCWFDNTGPRPITTSPAVLPDCLGGTQRALSVGTGDAQNQAELIGCLVAYEFDNRDACPWFATPPKPGSAASRRARRASLAGAQTTVTRYMEQLASLRAASPRPASTWGLLGPATTKSTKLLGQYTCRDWRRARGAARLAVVRRLTVFFGGPVAGTSGWGTVLPVDATKRLFNGRCSRRGSANFLLYKLYSFSAGFAGGLPPLELLRR